MYETPDTFTLTNDPVWIFVIIVSLIIIGSIVSTSTSRPPTVEELGRSSWTLLHTMASKYPRSPDRNHQKEAHAYLSLFAKFYPCSQCSEHMMTYMRNYPPQLANRDLLQRWLCLFHNDVNRKLGKPLFDCKSISSIHKRWGGETSTCPAKGPSC